MAKYCVGLTGGIASGKSTVAKVFESLGIVIADADHIAHQITQKNGEAMVLIQRYFGDEVLVNGALNRTLMREKIFHNPQDKQKLERILHPIIEKKLLLTVEKATSPYVILDVPLLFQVPNLKKRCQRILVIDCNENVQKERIFKRNGWDNKTIEAVMNAQISRQERLKYADDVIKNNHFLDHLILKIKEKHAFYLKQLE